MSENNQIHYNLGNFRTKLSSSTSNPNGKGKEQQSTPRDKEGGGGEERDDYRRDCRQAPAESTGRRCSRRSAPTSLRTLARRGAGSPASSHLIIYIYILFIIRVMTWMFLPAQHFFFKKN